MQVLIHNIAVQLVFVAVLFGIANWTVLKSSYPKRLLNRCGLFVALTAILFFNDIFPFAAQDQTGDAFTSVSDTVAKVIWWTAGASCLVGLVRIFLIFERKPREARLLQDLVIAAIYMGAALSIVAYVFRVPIGTLVATSGVFAIILGLALQSTLSDVFSGIALNIGRPYTVGDWIVLEDGTEGRVFETTWRATYLLSGTNDLISIPNSGLAKMKIVNRSSPTEVHATSMTIEFVPTTTPSAMIEVMLTVLKGANSILKSAPFSVRVKSMDAHSIELELNFSISSISVGTAAKNELFDLLFRHAKAAGLRLSGPAGAASGSEEEVATEKQHPSTAWRLLNAIPLLASLTEDEKEALSARMARRTFRKGEVIAKQGDSLTSMMILRSGVIAIESDGRDLMRLSPGDWFGEGGLLIAAQELGTSTALTAVVVYEIGEKDMGLLLKDRPAIADELGAALSKRIEEQHKILSPHLPAKPNESLGFKIRHLFDIKGS